MVPNHVMNEVLRRLTDAQTRKLARSVKLDPDHAILPPQLLASSPRPFEGAVDFDITIVALGQAVTWPAKMLWAGELRGHGLQMQSSLHILIPTREDDPAFLWEGLDHRMLPALADEILFERAEEAARSAEAFAGKSNP